MTLLSRLPAVRGALRENAPLGDTSWFRVGGPAEVLFKPADTDDLSAFLAACPADVPITVLGVCSNVIIRDGGIKGVVIKLGGGFAGIDIDPEGGLVRVGAAALDANVALAAQREGRAGLEFLSGIPGSVGGALRMNAGAYGSEVKDVLVTALAVDRRGHLHQLHPHRMGLSYRHCDVPEDYIFTTATFRTHAGNADEITARMAEIKEKRTTTQPVKARTGGSTFANPSADEIARYKLPEDASKAWQLIDAVGGRGLRIGGAQMSDLHCNFMLNTGDASAADLEALGEELRRRVLAQFRYPLRWEIKRMGEAAA